MQAIASLLRRLEWLPLFVTRVLTGVFFCITGGSHLFIAAQRSVLIETLVNAGVPVPEVTAIFVASIEFVFGGFLAIGLLSYLSSLLLGGIMVIAVLTERIHSVQGNTFFSWLSNFLYLPEVLYVLILGWLFFRGPGKISFDNLFRRNKKEQS